MCGGRRGRGGPGAGAGAASPGAASPGARAGLGLEPEPEPAARDSGAAKRRRRRRQRPGTAEGGRQVRFLLAPRSPVRGEPLLAGGGPAGPQELEAPAPRSSLALSLELRDARAAVVGGRFDASKAVEEQLRKSFQTRCALEESVAEGLNVPRSKRLYRDLVSLQVPEEQVLKAALREKLAMLPPPPPPPPRAPPPKEVLGQGPDVTVLCNPDSLCYEFPHLTVDGLPPLRLQARPRPSEDTFLMHRMLRRWEA
ncbi:protein phosphatase 1 regulatory subunit 35-like isoform X1 [Cricetulus griseus]|uniref:Protein phosphatase 1 regulatory subunit 35-like isoform X1 n=1 Tax=Cricetulus griseus TaxID=10029 RepID=A0A9J7GXT8_CRIGR|nr:protein phosphatase 1 regulatory subunit 35-like isoform X1 [Cricetulus griseus]